MATLLEISEELLALERELEDLTSDDGEVDPAAMEKLDVWFAQLSGARDAKIDAYAALWQEKNLRAAARKEELKRLQARVAADENQAKFLKQRLFDFLELHKTPKLETRRFKLSCCGNGGLQPLVKPEDPEQLPKEYQRVVIEADVDKIRTALAAGTVVTGCALKPRGRHLRIL